jgi:hypothetical protein
VYNSQQYLWRSECDGEMKENAVAGWWHKKRTQKWFLGKRGRKIHDNINVNVSVNERGGTRL